MSGEPRYAHLPPEVRSRITKGNAMIADYYDEHGQLRTPEERQAAQEAAHAAEAAETTVPAAGDDTTAGGNTEDTTAGGNTEDTVVPTGGTDKPVVDNQMEQRYRTLQGRFHALAEENRGYKTQLEDLTRRLDDLAKKPEKSEETHGDMTPLTAEERRVMDGDDGMLGIIERAAYNIVAPKLAELQNRIEALSTDFKPLTTSVRQTRQQIMHDTLAKELGANWRAQDEDPAFLGWLTDPDPLSGIERNFLFKKAVDSGDHARVVRWFKTYRQETGKSYEAQAPAKTPPATTGATPAKIGAAAGNGTGNGRIALDTLVHPGKARSTPSGVASADEPPSVTRAELSAFQQDVSRGRYRDKPEEFAKWRTYFDSAVKAGTVRER